MIREKISKKIKDAVGKCNYVWPKNATIEIPKNINYGDYATNCALIIAKKIMKNPSEVASNIIKNSKDNNLEFTEKNGFINIRVNKSILTDILNDMFLNGKNFDKKNKKSKTYIVDFSSPNIAKPMNIGHMRSTIIGDSLCRILKYCGNKVIGDNHLGDWGTQFGKLIYAYKKWAPKDKKISIDDMFSLYVRFHEEEKVNPKLSQYARDEFKKLEKGDKNNIKIWKEFKKNSLVHFKQIYELLDIEFDETLGESFYKDDLKKIINKALDLGVAEKSESAVIIPFEDMSPLLIQKKDGSTLYATRDLAAIKYRIKKFKADVILYVIGNEQNLYVKQLKAAIGKIGDNVKIEHIGFGLMRLKGEKMSTRGGKIVYLKEIIDKAIDKAYEIVKEKNPNLSSGELKNISKVVGIGAIKYNDLSQNRKKDINFNYNKILDFEGDSAPYIQYTYARAKSVLKKVDTREIDYNNIDIQKEEENLVKKIIKFSEAVEKSAKYYMPNYIANYVFELANEYNSFYQKNNILKSSKKIKNTRLVLTDYCSKIIKQSLDLLGIKVVEKM